MLKRYILEQMKFLPGASVSFSRRARRAAMFNCEQIHLFCLCVNTNYDVPATVEKLLTKLGN